MSRPRPILWLRERPLLADGLFALVFTAISLIVHITQSDETPGAGDPTWWRAMIVIGCVAPIALRRRHTIAILLVVTGFQFIAELTNAMGAGWIGVIFAAYALGAHTVGRRRMMVAIGCLLLSLSFIVVGITQDEVDFWSLVGSAITLVTAFLIGDNIRQRRERVAGLAERAERAEREQELLAQQRVSEERTRIARELHDVVAHSVSVMTIQAAAARRQLTRDPDKSAFALEQIETTGREAMNELRQILGVLRSDADDELTPQPSLAELGDIVAADPTLPISLDIDTDFSAVPAATQLAAYRVVQEALTNIRKHAGPVEVVEVIAHRTPRGLQVEVRDDGRGASADAVERGFGLIGMRERVSLADGSLHAGPRAGGGWRVSATFAFGAGE